MPQIRYVGTKICGRFIAFGVAQRFSPIRVTKDSESYYLDCLQRPSDSVMFYRTALCYRHGNYLETVKGQSFSLLLEYLGKNLGMLPRSFGIRVLLLKAIRQPQ